MILAAALVATATAACLDEDITGVREADIQILVSPTTLTAGGTVDLTFEAEGTGIVRIEIDWGDGIVDTTTFSGPLRAAGDRDHVYPAAGSFVIVGKVAATAGIALDSVTVTVN